MMANVKWNFWIQSPNVAPVSNIFFPWHTNAKLAYWIQILRFTLILNYISSNCPHSNIRKMHHRISEMYLMGVIKFLMIVEHRLRLSLGNINRHALPLYQCKSTRFCRYFIKSPLSGYGQLERAGRDFRQRWINWSRDPHGSLTSAPEALPIGSKMEGVGLIMNIHFLSRALSTTW